MDLGIWESPCYTTNHLFDLVAVGVGVVVSVVDANA